VLSQLCEIEKPGDLRPQEFDGDPSMPDNLVTETSTLSGDEGASVSEIVAERKPNDAEVDGGEGTAMDSLYSLDIKVIIVGRGPAAIESRIDENMVRWPWDQKFLDTRQLHAPIRVIAMATEEAAETALAGFVAEGMEAATVESDQLRWLLPRAEDIENGHHPQEKAEKAFVSEQLKILDRCLRSLLVQELTDSFLHAPSASVACAALNTWNSWSEGGDRLIHIERPSYYETDWAFHDADLYPGEHMEVLHRDGRFIYWDDFEGRYCTSPFRAEWLGVLGGESIDALSEEGQATLRGKLALLKEMQEDAV
jgi:hypothetical protein